MTTRHPEPGRYGNLTNEEEQKLKEMWTQLLIYMRVAPQTLTATIADPSSTPSSNNKKKGGLLGWGKAKDPDDATSQKAALDKSLASISPDKLKRAARYMCRGDNPDNLYLRFLRARKWDVTKALEMYGDTIVWRLESKVEQLLAGGEAQAVLDNDEGLSLQHKLGKAVIHGHDLHGRPVVTVNVQLHDPKAQTDASMERYTILVIEEARLCLSDPVDTAAVIFDMTNFTASNMDYASVKFMIQCFERHYPESLGFVLIHKAPWLFQGIWNVIKGWIDPVVAAKISFTKNYQDLTNFISVENIPKDHGGKREYEYEYISPQEGENDHMKDTEARDRILAERDALFDQYDSLTAEWIATAPDDSQDVKAKRDAIAEEIQKNYWKLDPYVRARCVYDRDGTFSEMQELLHKHAVRTVTTTEPETKQEPAVAAAAVVEV
jgi:hypothetical protein